MADKIFVDTNVWVYLYLHDDHEKYKIVEEYLSRNSRNVIFVITWQVVNEISNTLLRYKYTESEIREYIEQLCKTCTIQDFTKEIVLKSSLLREKYSFSFWDSIIVGSALFSECNTLISEDMRNGLNVEGKLLIKNYISKIKHTQLHSTTHNGTLCASFLAMTAVDRRLRAGCIRMSNGFEWELAMGLGERPCEGVKAGKLASCPGSRYCESVGRSNPVARLEIRQRAVQTEE
jgi:predicted nucleic acid-binding protein